MTARSSKDSAPWGTSRTAIARSAPYRNGAPVTLCLFGGRGGQRVRILAYSRGGSSCAANIRAQNDDRRRESTADARPTPSAHPRASSLCQSRDAWAGEGGLASGHEAV